MTAQTFFSFFFLVHPIFLQSDSSTFTGVSDLSCETETSDETISLETFQKF